MRIYFILLLKEISNYQELVSKALIYFPEPLPLYTHLPLHLKKTSTSERASQAVD